MRLGEDEAPSERQRALGQHHCVEGLQPMVVKPGSGQESIALLHPGVYTDVQTGGASDCLEQH